MSDCGVLAHAPLEVGIPLLSRARPLATCLALTAFAACAPAIRPTPPAAPPSPDRPVVAEAARNQDSASTADSARRVAESLVVPDSVNTALGDAIKSVSKLFDVPDSVVRGMASSSVVDVDSTSNVGGEPTWDIEVDSYVTQEKVAQYVNLFLGAGKTRFTERLQRGKQYEPMIREKFRAAGIPEDMYFLGLVESGYDPHAYSRAAAVGMWQFMSSTARGVGLRVDWWVDERRDPMKSTDAAARFIRDLRGQFGSLYLAAAAYNGGPGRVSRGLKKFDDALDTVEGEDCFFALAEQDYLRAETKNYVPQLIAAALLGKAPDKYGIKLDSVPRYAYDSVMVPSLTPVAAVARSLGLTVREVQTLNPHLLRGVTPPDAEVSVRIPSGTGGGFDSLFAALSTDERSPYTKVTTKKGESLASIANRHGVQVRHLQWFNRKISTRKGRLLAGQTLLVPTAAVVQGAFDVPDPSIERYGPSASSSGAGRVTHVVRRGESLGLLAKRYRTSVASLVRLNGLKRKVIYPGQTIIVRGGSARRSTARAGSSSTSSARSATAKKKSTARSSSAKSRAKSRSASKAKSGTAKSKGSVARKKAPAKKKAAVSKKKTAAR